MRSTASCSVSGKLWARAWDLGSMSMSCLTVSTEWIILFFSWNHIWWINLFYPFYTDLNKLITTCWSCWFFCEVSDRAIYQRLIRTFSWKMMSCLAIYGNTRHIYMWVFSWRLLEIYKGAFRYIYEVLYVCVNVVASSLHFCQISIPCLFCGCVFSGRILSIFCCIRLGRLGWLTY